MFVLRARGLAGCAASAALAALLLAGPAAAGLEPAPRPVPRVVPEAEQVDFILVDKSERRMTLMRDGEPVRSYRVALGRQPVGHKQRAGDGRTPVGLYRIDWRNPQSSFYRSLHISYPKLEDMLAAAQEGVDPGGAIMIHGDASSRDTLGLLKTEGDWTDGCIAVTDAEMDEIWALTPDGTPIEIRE